MITVAARDLQIHTVEVLQQVAAGAEVTITVNGTPVADLTAHRGTRRPSSDPANCSLCSGTAEPTADYVTIWSGSPVTVRRTLAPSRDWCVLDTVC